MGCFLSSLSTANGQLVELPDEIYRFFLFKYLDLDDIWALRLVSQSFYKIIQKNADIIELSFVKDDECCMPQKWHSTDKSIQLGNQIDSSKLDLLRSPWQNVLKLKRLKLEMCPLLFKLEELNKFTKLEILEINELKISFSHHLNLPELKALSISTNGRNPGCLELDTPKLVSLAIDSDFQYKLVGSRIKFRDFGSIEYLKVSKFDLSLLVFGSLMCLEIENDKKSGLNLIELELLKFRSLEKLRINSTLHSKMDLNSLANLYNSKGDNLEIFLEGVRVKEIETIDEYEKTTDKLKYQLDNYEELEDDLRFVKILDYDNLINLLPFYVPSNLFGKYSNIQQVKINARIEDEVRLFHFIKNCLSLYSLELRNASLNQRFFDRLPAISLLSELSIYENHIKIDFEFLKKMPYLVRFCTDDQDIKIENLKNLKYLKSFEFILIKYRNSYYNYSKKEYLIKVNKMYKYKNTILYEIEEVGDLYLPNKYFKFEEIVELTHKSRN